MQHPEDFSSPESTRHPIVTLQGGATAVGQFVKVSETKLRDELYEKGHLRIYSRIVRGVVVMEAFTLKSLAECLGMSMGQVEGRYHRGRLYNLKVDIPTGNSRPVRGFPLSMLNEIRQILETPGAYWDRGASEEGIVNRQPRGNVMSPLEFEKHGGKRYITIPALARHYGRSVTLIRRRIVNAGLMRVAKNLSLGLPQGGRPRRGWPEEMFSVLADAIENGAHYRNELEASYYESQLAHRHTTKADEDAALEAQMEAVLKANAPQLPAGNPPAVRQDILDLNAQLMGMLNKTSTSAA